MAGGRTAKTELRIKIENEMKIEQLEDLKKDVEISIKNLLGEKLKKIILYGSYARGDYDDESDIDFAVIVSVENEFISDFNVKIGEIISEVSLKYDTVISIILINDELYEGFGKILPFYNNIVSEGKMYYGI